MDDFCIVDNDLSCSLMGKIKDINALSNIYVIFADEGFDNVNISYLGGFWILIEACSVASKEKMLNHEGLASWFSELCIADPSFVSEDRLVWISIEGLPFNTWNNNAYAEISPSGGTLSEVGTKHSDSSYSAKEVLSWAPEFNNEFCENSSSDEESMKDGEFNSQKVDDIDHVSKYSEKSKDAGKSDPSFPPGFTPKGVNETIEEEENVSVNKSNSNHHCHAMGYMEGCSKNIKAIVDLQGVTSVVRGTWISSSLKLMMENVSFLEISMKLDRENERDLADSLSDLPKKARFNGQSSVMKISKVRLFNLDSQLFQYFSIAQNADLKSEAFDSIRWDYLDGVLNNFGFGVKWRGWIQACLSSAMGSIMVNGSPSSEFKFHKGIRIDESLTLSHLFYADDAVFIGKWDKANVITIVNMLKYFSSLASGLKSIFNRVQRMPLYGFRVLSFVCAMGSFSLQWDSGKWVNTLFWPLILGLLISLKQLYRRLLSWKFRRRAILQHIEDVNSVILSVYNDRWK
ncbi:hypothetical protein Tco_0295584 [Tanacetum coccineum]